MIGYRSLWDGLSCWPSYCYSCDKKAARANVQSLFITTNQAAIIALFRAINHDVDNLPPMPGVFLDYPAPVVRNASAHRELTMMRRGMPPSQRTGRLPAHAQRTGRLPAHGDYVIFRALLPMQDGFFEITDL